MQRKRKDINAQTWKFLKGDNQQFIMARGNWRNWDKLKTKRIAECKWCGYSWKSSVPYSAVCPKCNCEEIFAKDLIKHPEWEKNISRKCLSMKNYYKNG